MARTTLTAALKPLERRGLVNIAKDPEDGRGRLLMLTSAGERLLARAVPTWESEHRAVEEMLPGGEADDLRQDLRALAC